MVKSKFPLPSLNRERYRVLWMTRFQSFITKALAHGINLNRRTHRTTNVDARTHTKASCDVGMVKVRVRAGINDSQC